MSNELKPCPFCGGEPCVSFSEDSMPRWVWCPACEADGPPLPYKFSGTAEEALRIVTDKWNTRVVDAENERLRTLVMAVVYWLETTNIYKIDAAEMGKQIQRCREALEGTK